MVKNTPSSLVLRLSCNFPKTRYFLGADSLVGGNNNTIVRRTGKRLMTTSCCLYNIINNAYHKTTPNIANTMLIVPSHSSPIALPRPLPAVNLPSYKNLFINHRRAVLAFHSLFYAYPHIPILYGKTYYETALASS